MDKKEKAKGIIKEFKEFISKGNVIDMAVGVIIGAAFGKIVTSLVNNILMPIIGAALGGLDFTRLSFTIGEAEIEYGIFLQNVVDFLIVAVCIFFLIKFINRFKKKEEEKPAEEPKKSDEVLLLEEIRDLMKKK
jgi:large conductance mechanosensitive channel